jgi:heme oxygenase
MPSIALEPLRLATCVKHSHNLAAFGRYDEAEAAVRKAIELQPQAATNYARLAIILAASPTACLRHSYCRRQSHLALIDILNKSQYNLFS